MTIASAPLSGVDPYAPDTVAVYRLYDLDHDLIYVGSSSNPKTRFVQHAQHHAWWEDVASWVVEWFPDRDAAREEEAHLIRTGSPLYNVHTSLRPGRARRRRRPGGCLENVLSALQGEKRLRTMVVLSRLGALAPDVYGSWGPPDLKAFLEGFGISPAKYSGMSVVRMADVEQAISAQNSQGAA